MSIGAAIWGPMLAGIGKNMVDAYDGGLTQHRADTLASKLQGLAAQSQNGTLNPADLARGYLEAGDRQGALAAVQLAQAAEDRRLTRDLAVEDRTWRRSVDARDHAASRQDRTTDERFKRAGLTLQEMQIRAAAQKAGADQVLRERAANTAEALAQQKLRDAEKVVPKEDKPEILKAEGTVSSSRSTLADINRALELNDKTFSGIGAELNAKASASLPETLGPYTNRAKALDTLELQKLLGAQVLGKLKETFKGSTTEKELGFLADIEGGVNVPADVRRRVLERSRDLMGKHIAENEDRAAKLRAGTYYEPNKGEPKAPAQPAARFADDFAAIPEGKRFRAPDGKIYRKVNGKPVPD